MVRGRAIATYDFRAESLSSEKLKLAVIDLCDAAHVHNVRIHNGRVLRADCLGIVCRRTGGGNRKPGFFAAILADRYAQTSRRKGRSPIEPSPLVMPLSPKTCIVDWQRPSWSGREPQTAARWGYDARRGR